jgi:hypothetical protein
MAITYAIDGGADAAKFNINATSGALTFKAAPDFEKPGDANADNVYEVSVKATDATGLSSSKLIKVSVTDVSEGSPPQITSAGAVSVKENQMAVITITATDPDDTTTPPIEPPIEPPPGDWPNATNTGVQPGITLTNYTGPMTITAAGTVIENKTIGGTLEIKAANTTVRNCLFKGFNYWGILADNQSGTRVEHCEFDGTGSTRTSGMGVGGGTNSAVLYCNIHHMTLGIQLQGRCTVQHNYIHDQFDTSSNPDDRHFDGITVFGGGNQNDAGQSLIDHNWIHIPGGTASIFIKTEFGPISNVIVNNCNLANGSYTVYSEEAGGKQITGVQFTNNIIGRGQYGYANIVGNTVVWTNNKDPNGTVIPAP